jgi:hypothetical protein
VRGSEESPSLIGEPSIRTISSSQMRGLVTEVEPRTGLSGTGQIPATPTSRTTASAAPGSARAHRSSPAWDTPSRTAIPRISGRPASIPRTETASSLKTSVATKRSNHFAAPTACSPAMGARSGSVTKPSLSTTTAASPATGKGCMSTSLSALVRSAWACSCSSGDIRPGSAILAPSIDSCGAAARSSSGSWLTASTTSTKPKAARSRRRAASWSSSTSGTQP